jgi:hypothetical protein
MPPLSAALTFSGLRKRLLSLVRARLFNGEITERRLARIIGVSQPHIHNVLKGARVLKPELADSLLAALGLTVMDLIEESEARGLFRDRCAGDAGMLLAPVAGTPLGPGYPFPRFADAAEWHALPEWLWRRYPSLVMAPLAPDPASALPACHGFAVLTLDEGARLAVSPGHLAVLGLRGSAYVRRIRVEPGRLRVMGQRSWLGAEEFEEVDLQGESLLGVVRGLVVWSGMDFRTASPIDYMGSFLENPASR